jgi:hypothetical protein
MNSYVSTFYKKDNDIWGFPQEYKGIEILPIKKKDRKTAEIMYRLFMCPKTYIADRDILRMSYLKFIILVVQANAERIDSNVDLHSDIELFLNSVCKINGNNIETTIYLEKHPELNELYERLSFFLILKERTEGGNGIEIKLSEQDFDNIREIVLEQSGTSVEYIESYNPELEESLEFLNKDNAPLNFEEEIFSFCALTKMSEVEAGEKTLFQFSRRIEREVLLKDYEIFKAMESAGFISSKNKDKDIFKHYLSHSPRVGRYDSLMLNADEYVRESGLTDPNSNVIVENK